LIGKWNLLSVSLGIKIFILNSIGEKIILDSHWFMKDDEAIDWREGFQYFHWTRGISLRKGQGGLPRRRSVCVFFRKRRRRMSVGEKKLVLMCEKMLFMKKNIMCKQRAWQEVVCNK
jgi:hypothetical protein